jgi:two-component system response regulator AtoC
MPHSNDSKSHRILIADDEAPLRVVLSATLRRAGFGVTSVKNGVEALSLIKASEQPGNGEAFDLVIADLNMPDMDGMTLLSHIVQDYENLPVVILTAHGTVDLAVQALKKGAFDFLTKPYEREDVLTVINKALGQSKKSSSLARTRTGAKGIHALVGKSSQLRHVHDMIERVADTPSTVLITGESGTGKELVAQALHMGSSRRDKPFIRINCAAIPEALIEAELFGYERGAFTGAVTSKPGRFELADGGTLFLDEIGDLPIEMQVKLLRVLQESTFERVGGIKTIHMDIRLIAATNQNLQTAIAEGKFREDLFYRLNVVPIVLPSLKERSEDIPALVEHFVVKYNARLNRNIERFSDDALDMLKAYAWPGNIRELENIVERTLLFADSPVIEIEDLPAEIAPQNKPCQSPTCAAPISFDISQITSLTGEASMKDIVRQAMLGVERDLIAKALDETCGNVTHAARKLKISRKSMQLKMKELGLRAEQESGAAL